MATGGNSRDVRLGIQIDVAGEETLQRAADGVRKLGQSGALSADEVTALVSAFDKLGAQAGSLTGLKAAQEQVDALAARQREAADSAKLLRLELGNVGDVVAPLRQRQQELAESTAASRKAQVDASAALVELRQQYTGAARDTPVFTSRQTELTQSLNDARKTIASNNAELVKLKPALNEAAAAERTLAAQYERSTATLSAADAALRERNRALDSARASALAAGVATEDLAAAESALLASARATAVEVERLTQARRQDAAAAAAQADLDAQNTEVLKRQQAALIATAKAYEADVVDALNKAETQARETAAEFNKLATAQQEALTGAFGQTGVRSLQAIRTEINGVAESLTLLRAKYAAGAISAEDLARATSSAEVRVATLRRELQTIPALPNVFEKLNAGINDTINRFGSLTAAIATVGFAAKPILDANIQLENLRRTLTFVTGSAEVAAQQIVFLQEAANRAGLSLGQVTNSFSLFQAAVVKSGQSVQVAQDLFGGVAAAAGVLGISTERVSNILLALGQVANKGKVSLEELQGQIGEALPGALKLAADSIGVTTAELGKLLKDGSLLAEDFLPAFARQLNTTFGQGAKEVEGLAQAFNRVKNAATITSQQLLDTAAYRGLTSVLNGLATNFDAVVASTFSLIKAFAAFKAIDAAREFFGLKAAAEAAASAKLKDVVATEASTAATAVQTAAIAKNTTSVAAETTAVAANTVAKTANAAATARAAATTSLLGTGFEKVVGGIQGATSRLGSFVAALGGPYGVALAATITFSDQLGSALANVAAKFTGVADKLRENEARLLALAEAEKKAAEASATSAEVRGRGFTSLQVQYDKLVDAARENIQVSEKLSKAKKQEGEAAVILADLSGDEAAAKEAAAQAAGANEAAIRAEVKARESELTLLQKQRAELVAAAGAQSTWTESRKAFFADFDQNLEKKRADLEITRQSAEAEGAAADKAFQSARAYRDNAKSLEELKAAVAGAAEVFEGQRKRFKEGLITQDQLNQSARGLAVAQGLLRDGYEDANKAIQRRTSVLKETLGLQQQDIELARKKIDVDLKVAEASGQVADRLGAATQLKDLDIRQSQQKIVAATTEAALLREEARLLQERLRISDPLYEQKKREIEAVLNAARAKEKEGLIEQQNLRLLKTEYDNLAGTLNAAAKGFTVVGDAAAAAAKKIDVFSEAGRRARNDSFADTPFQSGSSAGANPAPTRTAAGPTAVNVGGAQLLPPDDSGGWRFVQDLRESQGVPQSQVYGDFLAGRKARYVAVNGIGRWVKTGAGGVSGSSGGLGPGGGGFGDGTGLEGRPRTSAPAGEDSQNEINIRLAQQDALRRGDQAEANRLAMAASEAAKARVAGTGGGVSLNVTIGGKQYGIGATNQAQADAIIASLEAAYAAGGG